VRFATSVEILAYLLNLTSRISDLLQLEETGQKYLQVEQTYFGYNFPTAVFSEPRNKGRPRWCSG
jgi:hypothetical protein